MNGGTVQGLTLANKVTLIRVFLVPVFVICLIYSRPGLALAIFILVSLADAADGHLARSRNEKTDLGAMLDPIADKLLMFSAYVVMGIFGFIPAWLAVIVISRDVVISLGFLTLYVTFGYVTPAPTVVGKLATVTQMIAIGFALLAWVSKIENQSWPLIFYLLAGALTIASGLHYIFIVGGRLISQKGESVHGTENPSSDRG